ncbi:hypothetical protein GOP47_0024040 [Adiantum capillus-veneris]|uniref:Methyltransferase type 11 domain-containing protein n=1 Tax=Adiantum capillus-veneris TaxID=13818 RepID=A0A9D4U561_ADICA|nr:hypothetical protein GOP47_0024040 [Adiantum capillus-veneris]
MGLLSCPPCLVLRPTRPRPCLCSPLRCANSSRLSVKSTLTYSNTDQIEKDDAKSQVELLSCPICFEPLMRKGPSGINQSSISRSAFKCNYCKKAFSSRDVFLDLTVTAGLKEYEEVLPSGTELFRNPLVSFVYERGWRQNFARSGFPGPDEEVKLAQEFLKPTGGGILLDVSCGSGLFSRRFAKSDAYSAVIGLDFSENMLRQAHDLIRQDRALANRNLALVRADVARLPFATGTVDAVHAGAALHCWPSPSSGVAEISRILKPGGVFVATTFLSPVADLRIGALKPLQQAYRRVTSGSSLRYWIEAELEDLCAACGFIEYRKVRRNKFIMLCATKPKTSEDD